MTGRESYTAGARDQLLSLLASKAYRHGSFTLASGRKSSHYVNCKPVSLSGEGLLLISLAILECLEPDVQFVAGLTLGADPLVSGVALTASWFDRPMNGLIVRKEAKGHGTGAWLEGDLPPPGTRITVLEDVVTTGGSSLKAVKQLRAANYQVGRVITIVDREEGGASIMKTNGLDLVSLFLLKEVANRATSLSS